MAPPRGGAVDGALRVVGLFSRYAGDDYCTAGQLASRGQLGMQTGTLGLAVALCLVFGRGRRRLLACLLAPNARRPLIRKVRRAILSRSGEAGVTAAPANGGAGDGTRTRDLLLGRQPLCQTELLPHAMAPPLEGAVAMAVRAYNIALCDFLEDAAIGRTSGHVRDECALCSGIPMIELHHDCRKRIAAVKARDTAEARQQLDPRP